MTRDNLTMLIVLTITLAVLVGLLPWQSFVVVGGILAAFAWQADWEKRARAADEQQEALRRAAEIHRRATTPLGSIAPPPLD